MSHSRRPLLLIALLAALVAAALSGCGEAAGGGGTSSAGKSGSGQFPIPPARLHAHAGELIEGGKDSFKAELAVLKGTPVVVNQWASWCGPCKFEFPFFAKLASRFAGKVAFLGVNSQDSRGSAVDFLRQNPVPYPHFYDHDASVAREFEGGRAWPTTAFYDARGKLANTHVGAYASQAKLDGDIRKYALGS